MRRWHRWTSIGLLTVLAVVAAYLGYASWKGAAMLDDILRVGSPIAQGSGAPAPQGPADIGYVGDPKAAYGYAFADVPVPSDVGMLPAWLVQPAGAPSSAWAIFVHGIGGRRENGYRFLPALHDADLPVLMISYRNDEGGPSSSDGLYALGLTEWRDLDAAVAYAGRRGARKIVLVAESMGGAIVGQFLDHSERAGMVEAIVLDAPMLDAGATLRALLARLHAPLPGLVTRGTIWLASKRYPFDLSQAMVTDAISEYGGPLFLSHGAGDRIVPVATSDRLLRRRAGPTEYLRTGADHIGSWKENPARYEAALRGFLATLENH